MVAPSRFTRFPFLPTSAALLLASALALPACGGGSTTTGGTGGSAGSGGSSDCPAACSGDTPVCDPDTKQCVGCLPGDSTCPSGQYCGEETNACVDGCDEDSDCPAPLVCQTATHTCVSCTSNSHCDAGSVCSSAGECVAGCTDSQPCTGGLACCDGLCTDLTSDPLSCSMCGKKCDNLAHATELCEGGACTLGECDMGFADCNQNPEDGCEWDLAFGDCSCTPGTTQDCYTGPPGTKDVGLCKAGTQTCNDSGTAWSACDGQVTPIKEVCANGLDDDCSGAADDSMDLDGDGWTACQGDCCDVAIEDGCAEPGLVNPGAFEVGGNTIDDDCDGTADNPLMACDNGLASNSNAAGDYAKAIDLCQTTTENPANKKDKKWGVISTTFSLTNGSGTPFVDAKSIRAGFGGGVSPLSGQKIAVLSTGVAAAQASPNNASPNYVAFQGGKDTGNSGNLADTDSPVPADWLAANANNLPNVAGCPEPQGGTTAHDPIMMKVRVRVPTNAKSFNVSTFFYSSEYPEWVCSAFNDFFVALLDSSFVPGANQVGNPADKNLAVYDPPGAGLFPVGVNLVKGTDLFKQCKNGPISCAVVASPPNYNGCTGTNQLTGTGFDAANPPPQFASDPGYCGTSNFSGGGTGWLTTTGNVKPGETMELRFATWDTGDGWYDSVVLLDNFVWSLDASTPGTHE